MVYFVIEASHLFRAGDKHATQFFVADVANYVLHRYFPEQTAQITVLHGSVKQEQGDRYAAALERNGIKVVRMKPIESHTPGKWYFKPAWYMHQMMGTNIPEGSDVVLVGFHNVRYIKFLEKYAKTFKLHLAAFATPSRSQGLMTVPEEFKPFLVSLVDLDADVPGIKAEFQKKPSNKS
jgi:hypothetical protein